MLELSGLERRRRWLWGLAATLLVGLALTVVLLSVSPTDRAEPVLLPRANFGGILAGLVGLVVLFVLYATWQQDRLLAKEYELRRLAAHEATLRERLGELSSLLDACSQLAQKLELRDVLSLAAKRVVSCLEADLSAIYLFNPRSGQLEELASVGKGAAVKSPAVLRPGDGVLGYVYSTREALTVQSEEMLARLASELGLAGAPRAALCAPIRFDGACLGVLCIARVGEGEAFVMMHSRALQALAEHCGAAIVKGFHYQRCSREAQAAA